MKVLSPDQYFKILGLDNTASLDEVKKAYRQQARKYHPDLNKSAKAADRFITINEAYEFLNEYIGSGRKDLDRREELIREWQKYRREEARKKAHKYSRERYAQFKKSKTYKASIVLNKAQIYVNLSVAVFVITMAVIGYIIKWQMVKEGADPPTLISFIFLLSIGLLFLLVSLAHLQSFYKHTRKVQEDEKKNQ